MTKLPSLMARSAALILMCVPAVVAWANIQRPITNNSAG